MFGIPSGTYVQQSRTPLGYQILVSTPGGNTGNLRIGVEAGAIVINSGEQAVAGGPNPAQQMSWSTQWVRLPADANLAATRVSRSERVVEVFVPRF
jgi:hypothetical protein